MFFVLGLMIRALAFVGGFAIAGWVGVVVVAAFTIAQYADIYVRSRTPKARFMRGIAHALNEADDDDEFSFHVHTMQAHPSDENEVGK